MPRRFARQPLGLQQQQQEQQQDLLQAPDPEQQSATNTGSSSDTPAVRKTLFFLERFIHREGTATATGTSSNSLQEDTPTREGSFESGYSKSSYTSRSRSSFKSGTTTATDSTHNKLVQVSSRDLCRRSSSRDTMEVPHPPGDDEQGPISVDRMFSFLANKKNKDSQKAADAEENANAEARTHGDTWYNEDSSKKYDINALRVPSVLDDEEGDLPPHSQARFNNRSNNTYTYNYNYKDATKGAEWDEEAEPEDDIDELEKNPYAELGTKGGLMTDRNDEAEDEHDDSKKRFFMALSSKLLFLIGSALFLYLAVHDYQRVNAALSPPTAEDLATEAEAFAAEREQASAAAAAAAAAGATGGGGNENEENNDPVNVVIAVTPVAMEGEPISYDTISYEVADRENDSDPFVAQNPVANFEFEVEGEQAGSLRKQAGGTRRRRLRLHHHHQRGGRHLQQNWYTQYWEYLPEDIQEAAGLLGYTQDAWDNAQSVYTDRLYWHQLTPVQQEAAWVVFGYTEETWDDYIDRYLNTLRTTDAPTFAPPTSTTDAPTSATPVFVPVTIAPTTGAPLVDDPVAGPETMEPTEPPTDEPATDAPVSGVDKLVGGATAGEPATDPPATGVDELVVGATAGEPATDPPATGDDQLEDTGAPVGGEDNATDDFFPTAPADPKDTYYKDVPWSELPEDAKNAAETLGYTQGTWNSDGWVLTSELFWDQLTDGEKEAATVLGYSKFTWDSRNGGAVVATGEQPSDPAQPNDAAQPSLVEGGDDGNTTFALNETGLIENQVSAFNNGYNINIMGKYPAEPRGQLYMILYIAAAACFILVGTIDGYHQRLGFHAVMALAGVAGVMAGAFTSFRNGYGFHICHSISTHLFLLQAALLIYSRVQLPYDKVVRKVLAVGDGFFFAGALMHVVISYLRYDDTTRDMAISTLAASACWCLAGLVYVETTILLWVRSRERIPDEEELSIAESSNVIHIDGGEYEIAYKEPTPVPPPESKIQNEFEISGESNRRCW